MAGHGQHDANEALLLLGERLDEVDLQVLCSRAPQAALRDNMENSTRYSTPFHRIFGGVQRSTLTCSRCGKTSQTFEQITSLTLDLPRGMPLDVPCLLRHYFEGETPPGYRCDGRECGVRGCTQKRLDVVRWPQTLCLHLKRFEWSARRGRVKLNDAVAFREHEHVDAGGVSYRLRSVVDHGGKAGGGHYVSFVRGHGGMWYRCDDEASPTRCDVERVLASQGYMLFYEREQ